MKPLFLLLSSLTFYLSGVEAQTKRALIIAIGNYTYWPRLSSLNDVAFISGTLSRQGFKKDNISVLTDQNCTHAGITKALNGLIGNAGRGDVVVIHFSTHGEQIEDDNGDETDGLDETIVSCDAAVPDNDGHFKNFQLSQQEFFRDDECGLLIDRLRAKVGSTGDVVLFMDLCHSGTGSRDNTVVRGNKPPAVSASFDPGKHQVGDSGVFKEVPPVSGAAQDMASFVVISASRAEEVDAEMVNNDDNRRIHMGSLSYAITKAFESLDPGTTYQGLFSRIQNILDDRVQGQHPVMEGNGGNRLLFGGKFVYQKPYVEVDNINANGVDIRIRAGLLAGLDTGAVISVYPAGTTDPAKTRPLAGGKVNEARSYTSEIRLNKKLPGDQATSYWVFVDQHAYNTKPISLRIDAGTSDGKANGFSNEEKEKIRERLKAFPLFTISDEAELILVKGVTADSLIVASNGYLFAPVSVLSDSQGFNDILQRYAQYKFLRELEIKDPDIHLEVSFVPVTDGKADTAGTNAHIINGVCEYHVGEKMALRIRNTGVRPFYFNVLDIQPDGKINAVLPQKSKNIYPDDLKVNGGSSYLFDKFIISITPPVGQEIFKVFASYDKIDLEDIAAGRGKTARGNLSALEKLVGGSFGVASRGTETSNISSADGLAGNILFRINPKK